jgi:hypothetical protein
MARYRFEHPVYPGDNFDPREVANSTRTFESDRPYDDAEARTACICMAQALRRPVRVKAVTEVRPLDESYDPQGRELSTSQYAAACASPVLPAANHSRLPRRRTRLAVGDIRPGRQKAAQRA